MAAAMNTEWSFMGFLPLVLVFSSRRRRRSLCDARLFLPGWHRWLFYSREAVFASLAKRDAGRISIIIIQ
jgi:hypothetical protein